MRNGMLSFRMFGLLALVALGLVGVSAAVGQARAARARAATAQACRGNPSPRDARNPLALAGNPGSDPLNGANFFVDGPRHGAAASAIASLMGLNPSGYPDDYSWARFRSDLATGTLARRLAADPGLRYRVTQLEKIASQPEPQRFSAYSQGGGPGAIRSQVNKIFCGNLTADPGSIPIINTYFVHAALGGCATRAQIAAAMPAFRRRIDEMAAATGNHPAVYFLETDALGSSACFAREGSLGAYEAMLRYEVDRMASLPHTVVYLEAGYSDANTVGYTARALNNIGIRRIRGFYTNDTHFNWTINEVRRDQRISRLTHGAHYVVNTAQNGNGPLLNRHPVTQGVENLCNPPGRGLGPRRNTHTRFARADAFLWTNMPGNSSGCGGGPPGGVFWPARAIDLAVHANGRLGPHFPSRPY